MNQRREKIQARAIEIPHGAVVHGIAVSRRTPGGNQIYQNSFLRFYTLPPAQFARAIRSLMLVTEMHAPWRPPVLRPHLFVALEFRLAGLLLGLPGVIALVVVVRDALFLRSAPPPAASEPLDVGTYGLAGLLSNGAQGVGHALRALNGVATWLLILFAMAMLLVVAFAVLLYVTGQGIGHQAAWARVVALALSVLLALASCALLALLRGELAPFALLPLGLSLYTLWVLIWRFA